MTTLPQGHPHRRTARECGPQWALRKTFGWFVLATAIVLMGKQSF